MMMSWPWLAVFILVSVYASIGLVFAKMVLAIAPHRQNRFRAFFFLSAIMGLY
jgi:hypothetical protein